MCTRFINSFDNRLAAFIIDRQNHLPPLELLAPVQLGAIFSSASTRFRTHTHIIILHRCTLRMSRRRIN